MVGNRIVNKDSENEKKNKFGTKMEQERNRNGAAVLYNKSDYKESGETGLRCVLPP
jgi:hypothetical protein